MMKKDIKSDNEKSFALDGGILIALAIGEEEVTELNEKILQGKINTFTSDLAITEMLYITCRKLGWKDALEKKQQLIDSRMINIVADSELIEYAAEYKCNRAIALADCFTLANAKLNNCPALFVRKEREISEEIQKKTFDVDLKFYMDD